MVKELAVYKFNFCDSINDRVLSRLSKLNNMNCEVYQNSRLAMIICPSDCSDSRRVYLFSVYEDSLVEVPESSGLISSTISRIMR